MDIPSSYSELIKPSWAPPTWLFGTVWSILYPIIFISFGYVLYQLAKGRIGWGIALPFLLSLVFNFAFTYIQFRLKNNVLASADILLTVVTLIWAMVAIFPEYPAITYVNIPYLLWGSFATILQITITYLNR